MVKHTRRRHRQRRNNKTRVKSRVHKKLVKKSRNRKHYKPRMTRRKQRGGNPAPIDDNADNSLVTHDDSNTPISFGYAMATVKPSDLGMANPIPIKSYQQCPSK